MDDLSTFIPMDRRQALAHGTTLPEQARGAALLADIAGFTSLAETLTARFGPQRGAEELTRTLNGVYTALIAVVDHYGGSVIGFSGDALTCWFDADEGTRATTCALALQQAMPRLAPAGSGGPQTALALKVAIATGPVRRFLVGDPQVQHLDALAGRTLERLAAAEHEAQAGEVILDLATAARLAPQLRITARRAAGMVISAIYTEAAPMPWPILPPATLTMDQVRPWVLPAVWERGQPGGGAFLAELRPAVALFLRFTGIDYDGDPAAGAQLDAYVRWVQHVLGTYGGFLIDLTIGDKGSYLYAAFGAPLAQAGMAARAAAAALQLRVPSSAGAAIQPLQTGLSQGVVWAGACGGPTRRTYAVLGDMVNLGARLMQHAAPGEILASAALQQATGAAVTWAERPPLQVKGKAAPVTVYALLGDQNQGHSGLLEPVYTRPLVGRTAELAWLDRRLTQAGAGQSQMVGLAGEAGMGKSRLVSEVMRRARAAGWAVYGGAAQAWGMQTPYLAWQALWRDFFHLDERTSPAQQATHVATALDTIAPHLRDRLPLLSPVLGLPLADTALTEAMDGALRKTSLEALLVDCLRARAEKQPLLLVLEDCHWLDPLSQDLLITCARALAQVRILLLLAYRPPEVDEPPFPPSGITALPHFSELRLAPLAPAAAARLVADQLAATPDDVPASLVEQVIARAEGNPFYLEELLHYLADQGIAPNDRTAWAHLEWPNSLHSLLLARIDRLNEQQRTVLKVASIIGRRFRFTELWGVYPDLGPAGGVQTALAVLDRVGLTPLEPLEREQVYLFKHIVTQEVTYTSLPYAQRAQLHEQFARWLEVTTDVEGAAPVDLLAYHYGQSANVGKQREYYRRAGDAAAVTYAHATAQDYYERLLPLLDGSEQGIVLLALGHVLERQGAWDAAAARYHEALAQAGHAASPLAGRAQTALGRVRHLQGLPAEAQTWLQAAYATSVALGDDEGASRALDHLGLVYEGQNAYDQAHAALTASQALCETHAHQPWARAALAHTLHSLGKLELNRGHNTEARASLTRCLVLQRARGDKAAIALVLNGLGYVATREGDPAAQALWTESLALSREIGDRWAIAGGLGALGYLARTQGDQAAARALYTESLSLNRDLGYRWGTALGLNNLGYIAAALDDPARARALLAESLTLFQELGDHRLSADCLAGLAGVFADQARQAASFLGAAARLLTRSGGALDPLEHAAYERTLTAARTALGAEDFTVAWDEGQLWSEGEAVAQARRVEQDLQAVPG